MLTGAEGTSSPAPGPQPPIGLRTCWPGPNERALQRGLDRPPAGSWGQPPGTFQIQVPRRRPRPLLRLLTAQTLMSGPTSQQGLQGAALYPGQSLGSPLYPSTRARQLRGIPTGKVTFPDPCKSPCRPSVPAPRPGGGPHTQAPHVMIATRKWTVTPGAAALRPALPALSPPPPPPGL